MLRWLLVCGRLRQTNERMNKEELISEIVSQSKKLAEQSGDILRESNPSEELLLMFLEEINVSLKDEKTWDGLRESMKEVL
jgi:hypothetical protein